MVGPNTPEAAIASVVFNTGVDVNTPYTQNANEVLFCKNFSPPQFVGPYFSRVTANFAVPPQGYFQVTVPPLQVPWKYNWSPCIDNAQVDRDAYNNPIVNAVYDAPSTPATRTVTKNVMTIRRNEAFYDRATYKLYENTVNSDTVVLIEPNGNTNVFSPGDMKCVSIRPLQDYTLYDTYVTIILTFEIYDPTQITTNDPFQLHLLNAGSNGFYNSSLPAKKGPLVYSDGVSRVEGDKLLDSAGRPLDTSLLVIDNNGVGQTPNTGGYLSGTPTGATAETVAGGDWPVIFFKYIQYKSIPFLPILTQAAQ